MSAGFLSGFKSQSSSFAGVAAFTDTQAEAWAKALVGEDVNKKLIDLKYQAKLDPKKYLNSKKDAEKAIATSVATAVTDAYKDLDGYKDFITEQQRRELAMQLGSQKKAVLDKLLTLKFPDIDTSKANKATVYIS